MEPEKLEHLRTLFGYSQWALGALILGAAWYLRPSRDSTSQFKSREADKIHPHQQRYKKGYDLLSHSKMPPEEKVKQLSGISIHGASHEILGIPPESSAEQIQKAYKDLMKRYHPDRVGAPGSREWTDAQGIAEALNRAKDEMLKKFKK